MRNDDFLRGLEGILDAHSGAIARVAKYVIENPDHVVRISLSELSEAADAGQATVVRMCREIGLEGFTDLKLRLSADLALRAAAGRGVPDVALGPLDDMAGLLKGSIDDTRTLIDPELLDQVAAQLASARRIDLFGMGVSGSVAELVAYRLLRLGYPAVCLRDPVVAREVSSGLDEEACIIAVSQSGATPETVQFLKRCRDRGAFTIAVTGYARSELANAADATLFVGRLREPAYGGSLMDVPRAIVLCEALALALQTHADAPAR